MIIQVLFVCLGNICRSPMAEAVFQQLVDEAGLAEKISVDSAGTGSWHVGEPAHTGTLKVLREHHIPYNGRARQVQTADMTAPNSYIVTMDQENMADLRRRFGHHPRLFQLLEFANQTQEKNVPDPYYTGDFGYVYELVTDGCKGLLAMIREREGL